MLKLTNLTKRYRDFTLNCTLGVRPGTITGLIGANGAGKSTTFKAILGLISRDGGEIELLGTNAANRQGRRKDASGRCLRKRASAGNSQ